MNTHQVLRFPRIGLVFVAAILLAALVFAAFMPLGWALVSAPRSSSPIQADSLEAVNHFHSAVNSGDVDTLLTLFAEDATVTDRGTVIAGIDEIRNWALYSQRMDGLRLTTIRSEIDGEKVIWLDSAYNGPELENRYYILRWEAIIREGKIQSLVVTPRYMPDLK